MSRAKPKLRPPIDALTSLDFVEGMARIRGYDAFRFDDDAEICWHCNGRRSCPCASCMTNDPVATVAAEKVRIGVLKVYEPIRAKCEACHESGLLSWLKEVA